MMHLLKYSGESVVMSSIYPEMGQKIVRFDRWVEEWQMGGCLLISQQSKMSMVKPSW